MHGREEAVEVKAREPIFYENRVSIDDDPDFSPCGLP